MQQKFELPPNKGYLKCCKTSRWKLWEQREQSFVSFNRVKLTSGEISVVDRQEAHEGSLVYLLFPVNKVVQAAETKRLPSWKQHLDKAAKFCWCSDHPAAPRRRRHSYDACLAASHTHTIKYISSPFNSSLPLPLSFFFCSFCLLFPLPASHWICGGVDSVQLTSALPRCLHDFLLHLYSGMSSGASAVHCEDRISYLFVHLGYFLLPKHLLI